ncbi:MAG TPA: alpha/beta hydrolase [Acidimicrobiales bacterium]|nr:alpha/beta hydrolase [Acidimicrobiales bacterium]
MTASVLVMAMLGTVMMVSGCTGPGPAAPVRTGGPRSTVAGPGDRGSRRPATTTPTGSVAPVVWSGCGSDLQCGSVGVPLDYSQPRGRMIQIAVERRPAAQPGQRIGSLVINPGGPGTSGIDDMENELSVLTPGLLDRFDIVSFDPRGVERSAPVACSAGRSPGAPSTASPSPATTTPASTPLPDPVPVTTAGQVAAVAEDRAYGASCREYSDGVLPFVGTVDAARDLDRIRAALGDQRLTFIGHSYGTLLGAVYAGMYPGHVRAMVLDGAIDPALGTEQMVIDQAKGFESVLDDFFRWCASTSACPWSPGSDPTSALLSLINGSRRTALPGSDGRSAGPGEFYNALLDDLYARSSWPSLGEALAEAAAGKGTALIGLSDSYASGGSTNGGDANNAINCLDHPVPRDQSAYPRLARRAGAAAPVFGPVLAWGLLQCAVWPVPPTRTPGPIKAAGSPPILVTGTTGDPATPYPWAVALARELAHGELVTWVGENHVAYFYSPCVRAIDQAYLVAGTLPAAGTRCTD